MSRTFISTIIGLAITISSWFLPWVWPAWPALTLLSVAPRPETYPGRAAFVVVLIVLNTAVWAAAAYIVIRGVTMKRHIAALFVIALLAPSLHAAQREKAIFAGGCFWCTESDFEKVKGVLSAISGYTGGAVASPSYEDVSGGGTGHREAVEVTFDPQKVSYEHLLEVFWHSIDPTDNSGQFCDHGGQYRSAIFFLTDVQRQQAEASKATVMKKVGKIVTDILPATRFYPAEKYHQDYYRKNPVRYHFYRFNCGRDKQLKKIWGDAASSK